jgi:hypothetical protein
LHTFSILTPFFFDSLFIIDIVFRSGRDHIELAHKRGLPIAIINIGTSFGDPWAKVKVNARCGEVMKILQEELAEGTLT